MRLLELFYYQNPVDGQRSWSKIHPENEQDIQKMLQAMAMKNEEASLRGKPTIAMSESHVSDIFLIRDLLLAFESYANRVYG